MSILLPKHIEVSGVYRFSAAIDERFWLIVTNLEVSDSSMYMGKEQVSRLGREMRLPRALTRLQ